MVQGVAMVIEKDGRYLMGRRSAHKKSAPGYWCAIAGKIEDGETQEEAVVREVREEVGLDVTPVAWLCSFDTHDGGAHIHWWTTRIIGGEASLNNDENSELAWVTLAEMERLTPIFPEDIDVFRRLIRSKT